MRKLGLIGGTGAAAIVPRDAQERSLPETPWGSASGRVLEWRWGGVQVAYLARHGASGDIAPHCVNYRANIWSLRHSGVDAVIGLNAVGGISTDCRPGRVVIPDQLIDYTWGRQHTYFDGTGEALRHIEFDPPFDAALRQSLLSAGARSGLDCLQRATYGVTQGPRLETAAEIDRLEADGCDVVGMTAMPEAGLAREAGLAYAICAVVVNRAAGRLPSGESIHGQLTAFAHHGMAGVAVLLQAVCVAAG